MRKTKLYTSEPTPDKYNRLETHDLMLEIGKLYFQGNEIVYTISKKPEKLDEITYEYTMDILKSLFLTKEFYGKLKENYIGMGGSVEDFEIAVNAPLSFFKMKNIELDSDLLLYRKFIYKNLKLSEVTKYTTYSKEAQKDSYTEWLKEYKYKYSNQINKKYVITEGFIGDSIGEDVIKICNTIKSLFVKAFVEYNNNGTLLESYAVKYPLFLISKVPNVCVIDVQNTGSRHFVLLIAEKEISNEGEEKTDQRHTINISKSTDNAISSLSLIRKTVLDVITPYVNMEDIDSDNKLNTEGKEKLKSLIANWFVHSLYMVLSGKCMYTNLYIGVLYKSVAWADNIETYEESVAFGGHIGKVISEPHTTDSILMINSNSEGVKRLEGYKLPYVVEASKVLGTITIDDGTDKKVATDISAVNLGNNYIKVK